MAGYCCRYYSPSVLPLHLQHDSPLQPRNVRGGGRRRGLTSQVAASSSCAGSGAQAEPVKAATDAELFQPSDTRPIMLFDEHGVIYDLCNLCKCNGGVRFVREHDLNRKLLQRSGRAPDDISSIVLVEKNRSYIKSEAVLRIMENLNLPFPKLGMFLKLAPLFVRRDFVYDNVANNRYTVFGHSESESCEIL